MGPERDAISRLEYEPLDTDRYEIRLLRLLHNNGPDIDCELANFPLDDGLEYVALSYCWTQAPPQHKIVVNNVPFMVRPNLFNYLQQAQKEGQRDWIFVDAICIDQQDPEDKMKLMPRMRFIYAKAKEVVAWLGCEETACMDANLLSRLQHICDQEGNYGTSRQTVKLDDDEERLLSLIIRSEYWQRVWIVQEIALATVTTIRYGPLHMSAGALSTQLWNWITGGGKGKSGLTFRSSPLNGRSASDCLERGSVPLEMATCSLVLGSRTLLPSPQSSNRMLEAISACCNQRCTEPYDLVFGTLALSGSCMQTDYRTPKIELFLRALIEGLLGYKPQLRFDATLQEHQFVAFCNILMARLGLYPDQPVTAIITADALKRCGQMWKARRLPLQFALSHCSTGRLVGLHWLYLATVWSVRTCVSQARIKRYRTREDIIPDPDNTMSKTYDGWIAFVEEIFNDVRAQVQPNTDLE